MRSFTELSAARVIGPALMLLLASAFLLPASAAQQENAADEAAILVLARAANASGDHASAVEFASRLIALNPESGEAFLVRALAHYRLGSENLANGDLAAALAVTPILERLLDGGESAEIATGGGAELWPTDFLDWARNVSSTAPPVDFELPEVSLADLNLGVETQEVVSHFVVDVEIVMIPVIVEDHDDQFMSGLAADSFTVLDGGGEPISVSALIPEDEPTSVGVLIDASSSMSAKTAEARAAVAQLATRLLPDDEILLIQFADKAEFLSPFSTDRELLAVAMDEYETGDGRALYDAIALGLIQMRQATYDKKVLIVLADGDDVGSETDEAAVRLAAQREGVSIYAILTKKGIRRWRPGRADGRGRPGPPAPGAPAGPPPGAAPARRGLPPAGLPPARGSAGAVGGPLPTRQPGGPENVPEPAGDVQPPPAFLQELVHNTGGLVALRPPMDDRFGGLGGWLDGACLDITSYVNNQYLIIHESLDPPPRGQFRRLRVRVAPPHKSIRARSGYVR